MPIIELSWNNHLGITLAQCPICCYELPKPPRDSCTFNPDQSLHMVQRFHTNRWLTRVALTQMFCRETILGPMNMSVFHQTAMFIRPRTTLLILMSNIVHLQDYLLGLQSRSSQMMHLDSLLLSHPWRCGWLRRTNFLLQGKVSIKGVRCYCWGPKTSCRAQDKMPKWTYYVFCTWIACQSYYKS